MSSNAAAAASLVVVKGRREGELEITQYPTKLTCSFNVALAEEALQQQQQQQQQRDPLYVLYRLRVKESSILFSKTYGLLGRDAASPTPPSAWDSIVLYAQPAVMEMGRLSTIRVEYIAVGAAEARELLSCGELEKEVCRPFFTRGGTRHYEVKCTFRTASPTSSQKDGKRGRGGAAEPSSGSRRSTTLTVVALATTVCVLAGVVLARRRGVSLEGLARAVRRRGAE
ncbi:hypothetical protein NESM_000872300 [Novymonas esmeraldas]|uniref:Uncharacterized protein n=1 Tax=Novymonas esmeraldas TaxID=1808958 RepID=A0AAW0EZY3_9TRYP